MFKLVSEFKPKGDQPKAIESLTAGFKKGVQHQVLLGVTGSGKTFTMACVIANIQKPTLIISHNKTLAAQLYGEFKEFFPENAVEYFVSYYDYYQPESYIPQTDTYIEKDSSINDEIDKLRHSATSAILSRKDVIIIASVSCIYNIGSPDRYQSMHIYLENKRKMDMEELFKKLVEIQYIRNDTDFYRGRFRVRGDTVEIFPASYDTAIRVEFFGNEIEKLSEVDPITGDILKKLERIAIYPAQHLVTPQDELEPAIKAIEKELAERTEYLKSKNKLLEAQRIEQRTLFDIEMLREIGFCKGIENYSRYLDGRKPGDPPFTLLDYFPSDALIIIDESHVGIPQFNGMYEGDRSRKNTLIDYGFRLPSAYDNRPLKFSEFEKKINQVVYVSATPANYELEKSKGNVVEQVIRPTGLMDPEIIVKPAKTQVDTLITEIHKHIQKKNRVLVTTLTKRMSEDLTEYLKSANINARYLHSDIETLERIKILQDLRRGTFDVLVGINLLREGLDLPEVSLVAILDADKEGFLRSERSLIQTMGRAARNIEGKVLLFGDTITKSMKRAISETERRRKLQFEFNKKHNITPETIKKSIRNILSSVYEADYFTIPVIAENQQEYIAIDELPKIISELELEMKKYAGKLEFEKAAAIRDRIKELHKNANVMSREGISVVPLHSQRNEISQTESKHKKRRIAQQKFHNVKKFIKKK